MDAPRGDHLHARVPVARVCQAAALVEGEVAASQVDLAPALEVHPAEGGRRLQVALELQVPGHVEVGQPGADQHRVHEHNADVEADGAQGRRRLRLQDGRLDRVAHSHLQVVEPAHDPHVAAQRDALLATFQGQVGVEAALEPDRVPQVEVPALDHDLRRLEADALELRFARGGDVSAAQRGLDVLEADQGAVYDDASLESGQRLGDLPAADGRVLQHDRPLRHGRVEASAHGDVHLADAREGGHADEG